MHEQQAILLVEDHADEALTLRALKKNSLTDKVAAARAGVEAVDYLLGTGSYAGRNPEDLPRTVLLDLKPPKLNRFEVVENCARVDRPCCSP